MRTAWIVSMMLLLGPIGGCSTTDDEPPLTHEERPLQKRIERREASGGKTGHMKRRAAEMRIHASLRHHD